MKRRDLLKTAAKGAATAIMATPAVKRIAAATAMMNRGRYRLGGAGEQSYSARAVELVQRSTVIDMLAPLSLSTPGEQKLLANPDSFRAVDYATYRQSGINVFHEASGYSGPNAYTDVLQFSSSLNGFLAHHDNLFERIDTPARLDGIKTSG
jgi:membrane dipeptidase